MALAFGAFHSLELFDYRLHPAGKSVDRFLVFLNSAIDEQRLLVVKTGRLNTALDLIVLRVKLNLYKTS